MRRKQEDEAQKSRHHDLGNALQALFKAEGADDKAEDDRERHVEAHLPRIPEHGRKDRIHRLMTESCEITAEELHKVRNHPTGNRRVVHHEQGAAQQADPAVHMPKAALRFQSLVSADRTLLARASHRKLHGEHRYAHDHQKEQIKEHKEAAVRPRHIGEFPNISDSDGAARAHQNESQPGPKTFSLHESNSPVYQTISEKRVIV